MLNSLWDLRFRLKCSVLAQISFLFFCFFFLALPSCSESPQIKGKQAPESISLPLQSDDQRIAELFKTRTSGIMVESSGFVAKTLLDDQEGSRHQRFILRLASGQTLLVTHNIDLAARIKNLRKGDFIKFRGQYEWNSKGGLIHWTHHDPARRHPPGWLEHNARRYE